MKIIRKRHDAEFQALVALEALKGLKTIQQIVRRRSVPAVPSSCPNRQPEAGQPNVPCVFEASWGCDHGAEIRDFAVDELEASVRRNERRTIRAEFFMLAGYAAWVNWVNDESPRHSPCRNSHPATVRRFG